MRKRLAFLALLQCLACAPDDPYDGGLAIAGPVGTQEGLTYVDAGRDELVFVRPGDDAVDVLRRTVSNARSRVLWIESTLDGDRILALVGPETEKEEDVSEQLRIYAADGEGDPVVLDVLAPFDAVAFSPDRRYAVLHFGAGGGSGVLQNANQVAIVDLKQPSVRDVTLQGFGGRLSSVHFPTQTAEEGSVTLGGRSRDIIAFLAEGEVVLADVADPQVDQVAVRFFPDVPLSPIETLLRPGNDLFDAPVLFLRSQDGADVAMLTLVDELNTDSGDLGFSAQVSLLPVGNRASDFVVHDSTDVPYLVTIDPLGLQVVFTDIRTQQGFSIALEGVAENLFIRTHETSAGPVPQLVTWARGATVIHTLELDGIEQVLGRRPSRLIIQSGIEELVVIDEDRLLVASGLDLYIVDLAREQVTPLAARSPYDPHSSALSGNQLLLGTPGQEWISTVDLLSLNPESMLLDEEVVSFHHVPAAGKVMVVHGDRAGYVTVASADDPSRATSYSAWGFLYEGLLDQR